MLTFKHLRQVGPLFLVLALALGFAFPPQSSADGPPKKHPTKAELDAQWHLWRSSFGSRRSAEAHRIRWMNGVDGHCGELVDGVIVRRNPLTCRGWHPTRLEQRNGNCLELAPGDILVSTPPESVCTA